MNLEGEKIPQPYLVSAILVAITIFLTPGGGLLNTWEEWETKMKLDFSYWKRKKMVTREKLTCVWLTVGMRECKGMMTNRSGKTEEQKQPDSKCFGWHWALVLVVQAAQSRLSTTMAIRSIYSVQKADSTFIYPTIVKKYPIHLNSDPLPSYFI